MHGVKHASSCKSKQKVLARLPEDEMEDMEAMILTPRLGRLALIEE